MRVIVLATVLLAAGCGARLERLVINTASFDHSCPKEQVRILAKAPGLYAYDLEVCGQKRKYRDFGAKSMLFVDVTDGTPQKLPSAD